jgi:hypothetical protein
MCSVTALLQLLMEELYDIKTKDVTVKIIKLRLIQTTLMFIISYKFASVMDILAGF